MCNFLDQRLINSFNLQDTNMNFNKTVYTSAMFKSLFHSMKIKAAALITSALFFTLTILLHFLFFQSSNWGVMNTPELVPTSHPIKVRVHNMPLAQLKEPPSFELIPKTELTQQAIPPIAPISKKEVAQIDKGTIASTNELTIPLIEPVSASTTPTAVSEVNNSQEEYSLRILESAQMDLTIERLSVNGNLQRGVGKMLWLVDDEKYSFKIEAGLSMLVTTLNLYKLTSEGTLGEYGLMPKTLSEARLARSETATHFNYETNTVSFSASTKKQALEIGAQDKASVLMQLASLGYSNASQFVTGREFIVQVAEERDASIFTFVVGEEAEIDSSFENEPGKIKTVHLIRPPKLGSYNSQLEIWLAPSKGWYPIQIKNTESNGTITTQKVTKLQLLNNKE